MKTNPLIQNNPNNNDIISRFQKFRQSFSGNPQQQVQQLLNSGRISQDQYNAAVQKANALAKMMGM
jgi:hypothetical protein